MTEKQQTLHIGNKVSFFHYLCSSKYVTGLKEHGKQSDKMIHTDTLLTTSIIPIIIPMIKLHYD